jgi:hypothetical protein
MMHMFGFGAGMFAMGLLWLICLLMVVAVVWGLVSLFRIQKELAAQDK